MRLDLHSGHAFHGSPMEILIQMKRATEGVDDLDLGAYVDWVVDGAATDGILLFVVRGPLYARAESLLRELGRARLARVHAAEDPTEEDIAVEDLPTARLATARELWAALQ